MDRSDVIGLVNKAYNKNSFGKYTSVDTVKRVYCNVSSVTRAEWYEAGQQGLKPEFRVTLFAYDYDGQDEVIYNGVHYSVYRTYFAKNDSVELYVEAQGGVTNGNTQGNS